MNPARKAATEETIKLLSMFDGNNDAVKEVEAMLNGMSDKAFDAYMKKLRSGEEIIPYIMPNLTGSKLSADKNIKIGKKLGHDFFQRLWLTDPVTGRVSLTPEKYLVIDLPLRRQQQHLLKKISIPESNNQVDDLTGQPTAESKGSRLSFPEMQILASNGLNDVIRELLKFRGGDTTAYNALTKEALSIGTASMNAVDDETSKPKATMTLATLLKAAHIDNNLLDT